MAKTKVELWKLNYKLRISFDVCIDLISWCIQHQGKEDGPARTLFHSKSTREENLFLKCASRISIIAFASFCLWFDFF
jgi:hypothetical protein